MRTRPPVRATKREKSSGSRAKGLGEAAFHLAKRPEKGASEGEGASPHRPGGRWWVWRRQGLPGARAGVPRTWARGFLRTRDPSSRGPRGRAPCVPTSGKNHPGAPSASKIPGKAPEPERLGAGEAPAPPSARGAPGYRAGSDAGGSATWRPGPDRRGEPWREMRRVRPQTRARRRAPSPESAKPQRKARSRRENLFRLRELHRGKSSF